MADLYPVTSDLSYLVLQKRRGLGELATPELDEANRRVHPSLPSKSAELPRGAWRLDRARDEQERVTGA